jgi:hypothetical protein
MRRPQPAEEYVTVLPKSGTLLRVRCHATMAFLVDYD